MSQRIPVTEDPTCVRGFRDEVAAHIIKEAQRQYPEAIKFHFNTAVEKIDLERQTIYALSAESGPEQVQLIQMVASSINYVFRQMSTFILSSPQQV